MRAVVALPPVLRPEIDGLYEAESAVRNARRHLINREQPADEGRAFACAFIAEAIAQLVATRLLITAADAAPSKDV